MTSNHPLDTELDTRSSDIPCFSAGHTKHEWTSWACMEVMFPYLEEEYRYFLKSKDTVAESSEEDGKGDGKGDGKDDTEKSEEVEKEGIEENVEMVEKKENAEKDEKKDEKREDL